MRKLLETFLTQNNYFGIVGKDLALQLVSHPDYPSVKAITDTIDYFKIENIAVNVPKENLEQLPDSFLALLNEKEKNQLAIASKGKGKVYLHFDDESRKTFSTESFKEAWTGSIVVIEEARAANIKHGTGAINGTILFLALCLVLFFAILFYAGTILSFLLASLSLLGVYLTYFIVKEEVGVHSRTIAKFCAAVNRNSNCAAVINSASSKLFSTISLSDLSVTYFVAFTLIYPLLGFNYTFSLIASLTTVPAIVFSIYQQAVALKQWCALCLGVIIISIAQGVIVVVYSGQTDFSIYAIAYSFKALFIIVLTFASWQFVKALLASHLKLPRVQLEFLKFKRNPDLFKALLAQKSILFPDHIPEEYIIRFGAQNPIVKIDAVTNPMCGYCVDAFNAYKNLLTEHEGGIQINMIFNVPYTQTDNMATQVAAQIIEVYRLRGSEGAWKALSVWYEERNVEKWQAEFGNSEVTDNDLRNLLKNHKDWCKLNKIDYTPATVIDDHLYPMEYAIVDLPRLVGDRLLEKKNDVERYELADA